MSTDENGEPFPKDKADETEPAIPSEQIEGGDQPEEASAESVETAERLEYDSRVENALRGKITAYRSRCSNRHGSVEMGELKGVYARGLGAYSSSSAPGVTSRHQWAMARVRSYLNLRCCGEPANPNYVQDNDLLPSGHPESTRGES